MSQVLKELASLEGQREIADAINGINIGVTGWVDSVADLRALDAPLGITVATRGYYEPNDGGNGFYYIQAKEVGAVDDGGSVIFLDNDNEAKLITDGTVNVKQFGAKGDGTDTATVFNNIDTFAVANSLIVDYSGYKDLTTLFANLYQKKQTITLGNVTIPSTVTLTKNYYREVLIVDTTFRIQCDYAFTIGTSQGFFISFKFDNCHFIGDGEHKCHLYDGKTNKDIVNSNFSNCDFNDVYLVDSRTRLLQSCFMDGCVVATSRYDFITTSHIIALNVNRLNMEAQSYSFIKGSYGSVNINNSIIEGLSNGFIIGGYNTYNMRLNIKDTYFETDLFAVKFTGSSVFSAVFESCIFVAVPILDVTAVTNLANSFLELSNLRAELGTSSYNSMITCNWKDIRNLHVYNISKPTHDFLFADAYNVNLLPVKYQDTRISGSGPWYLNFKNPLSILFVQFADNTFKYLVPTGLDSSNNYKYTNMFDSSEVHVAYTAKTNGKVNRYYFSVGSGNQPTRLISIPFDRLLADIPMYYLMDVPYGGED